MLALIHPSKNMLYSFQYLWGRLSQWAFFLTASFHATAQGHRLTYQGNSTISPKSTQLCELAIPLHIALQTVKVHTFLEASSCKGVCLHWRELEDYRTPFPSFESHKFTGKTYYDIRKTSSQTKIKWLYREEVIFVGHICLLICPRLSWDSRSAWLWLQNKRWQVHGIIPRVTRFWIMNIS